MLSTKDFRFVRYIRNAFFIKDVPAEEDDNLCELSFNLNDPTAPEAYRLRDEQLGSVNAAAAAVAAQFPFIHFWQPNQGVITVLRRITLDNFGAAAQNVTIQLVKSSAWPAGGSQATPADTRNRMALEPLSTMIQAASAAGVIATDTGANVRSTNIPATSSVQLDVPLILSLAPDGHPWGVIVRGGVVNQSLAASFDFYERTPNLVERNFAG